MINNNLTYTFELKMEKIEVGVRIRPLSKREEEQGEVRVLGTLILP
jgi:hypothetical protein